MQEDKLIHMLTIALMLASLQIRSKERTAEMAGIDIRLETDEKANWVIQDALDTAEGWLKERITQYDPLNAVLESLEESTTGNSCSQEN